MLIFPWAQVADAGFQEESHGAHEQRVGLASQEGARKPPMAFDPHVSSLWSFGSCVLIVEVSKNSGIVGCGWSSKCQDLDE